MTELHIHKAAKTGNLEEVEHLLANGADIEAKDCYGRNPLHHATCNRHLEIVQVLLNNNADIEAIRGGGTSLHYAAWEGHLEMVQVLLDNNADIEAKDCYGGWTPFHCAAYNGHLEVVQVLLDNNAKIEAKCNDGRTPLSLARKYNATKVAERLELFTKLINIGEWRPWNHKRYPKRYRATLRTVVILAKSAVR